MLKQATVISLLTLFLGGCYIDSEPPKPWHPSVERASKHYEVLFKGQTTHLSSKQHHAIKKMIASYSQTPPLHARLVLRHGKEDMLSPLLKNRVKTLQKALMQGGIGRKNIDLQFMNNGLSFNAKKADSITVVIDQFQAIPPKCGWDEDMHLMVRPEGEKNFGCATAANLAHMIDDPHDLLKGRPLANADGPANSLAVLNLRTDKTKELKIEEAGDN